jgi:hypothetical protein
MSNYVEARIDQYQETTTATTNFTTTVTATKNVTTTTTDISK